MRLHEVVEAYIAFKRALGIRLESEAGVLRAFCRSVGDTDVKDVKPAAVLAFVAGAGPVTRTWKQKASVLRSFYRYAVSRGHATSAPLPTAIPKFPPMRTPHIYSTDELKRLLAATEMLDTPRAPLRALAYRTLLLLLYGTGMRLNEALALTLNDVDLINRLITVRNTKFLQNEMGPSRTKTDQRARGLRASTRSDIAHAVRPGLCILWHGTVGHTLALRCGRGTLSPPAQTGRSLSRWRCA